MMKSQSSKQEALKRLAYIEGHIRGIRKMVEGDQYCVDVLKQTYAVQRALDKFEGVLLRNHLNCCVPESLQEGNTGNVVNELEELFELSRR